MRAYYELMPPPTINRIQTASGPIWRITYAGMTREHRQDWQAAWLFKQATSMYYSNCDLASSSTTRSTACFKSLV
jgi:hypothetical protein